MSKSWLGVLSMVAALAAPHGAWGRAETGQTPTIAEKTAGAQKIPGYFKTASRLRPSSRTGHPLEPTTIGMAGTDFSA
jgi:hypothetical protein